VRTTELGAAVSIVAPTVQPGAMARSLCKKKDGALILIVKIRAQRVDLPGLPSSAYQSQKNLESVWVRVREIHYLTFDGMRVV
jgi:hypothetical protein